jgi:hypothetical protein
VLYSIYKLDTTVVPNTLQIGEESGVNDGSTEALRHITLGSVGFKQ